MKSVLENMIKEEIENASKKFGEKGIIFTEREKAILEYGLNIGIMIAGKALVSSGCEIGKDEPKKEEPTDDISSINLDEIMPCDTCHGTGIVPIGPGVRGVKKCPDCNGLGRMSGNKPIKVNPGQAIKIDDPNFYIPTDEFRNMTINGYCLLTIPMITQCGVPNANGITYSRETFEASIKSDYFNELIKIERLYLVDGHSNGDLLEQRTCSIDVIELGRCKLGYVNGVTDGFISVKADPKFYYYIADKISKGFKAYMTYIGSIVNNEVHDMRIMYFSLDKPYEKIDDEK